MATKALEDELARCAREYETVSRSLTDIRARLERTPRGMNRGIQPPSREALPRGARIRLRGEALVVNEHARRAADTTHSAKRRMASTIYAVGAAEEHENREKVTTATHPDEEAEGEHKPSQARPGNESKERNASPPPAKSAAPTPVDRLKARDRKMFGLLRGTLLKAKTEETQLQDKARQRKELEQKAEAKIAEDLSSLFAPRRDNVCRTVLHHSALLDRERVEAARVAALARRQEEIARILEEYKAACRRDALSGFPTTEAKPHIYYLPHNIKRQAPPPRPAPTLPPLPPELMPAPLPPPPPPAVRRNANAKRAGTAAPATAPTASESKPVGGEVPTGGPAESGEEKPRAAEAAGEKEAAPEVGGNKGEAAMEREGEAGEAGAGGMADAEAAAKAAREQAEEEEAAAAAPVEESDQLPIPPADAKATSPADEPGDASTSEPQKAAADNAAEEPAQREKEASESDKAAPGNSEEERASDAKDDEARTEKTDEKAGEAANSSSPAPSPASPPTSTTMPAHDGRDEAEGSGAASPPPPPPPPAPSP